MKALVTGGAGFIGSALVERLVAEGHQVDVVDDLSAGSLGNLAVARSSRSKRLVIHQLDVRDAALVELVARRQPEVIFHLAAHDDGAGAVERATLDAEVNVIGALNLLEGARLAGARKVVFASCAASTYEAPEASELPLRESHPQRPLTPHGVAKLAVVHYLAAYRERHALEYTALVLGSVYGPGRSSGVVATFAERLVRGLRCVIEGDGEQTRDFVFIDDVVDAFVRAAERGSGLMVNVGSGVETSIRRLHEVLCELVGVASEPEHRPGRPGEPTRLALDPGRARIHLGWQPWTPLEEGLRQTLPPPAPPSLRTGSQMST